MSSRASCAIALSVALLTSCGGGGATTPPVITPPPTYTASGILAPLEVYGPATTSPGSACSAGRYREFDFWLGEWDITVNGNPAGVSSISSLVAGCAMLEFYQGGAGQSLNVYDAANDTWIQTYVFATPGVALLRGGLVNSEMILEELRDNGNLDRWTWTQLNATQVRQHYQIIAPGGAVTSAFNGVYTRRSSPASASGPVTNGCPASDLAFVVGSWNVFEGDPAGTDTHRGVAAITSENRGCLLIERTVGASSFEGISFIMLNQRDNKLLRDYMDSDGRYLRTTGTLANGKVTLTGTRKGADGSDVTASLIYESVSPTEFRLTYQFSPVSVTRTYRYIKR